MYIGIRLLALVTALCISSSAFSKKIDLYILETSDIHNHILGYDYFKDEPTEKYGLARVATLIEEFRKKHPDALLVDVGDLIQGNPLAELHAKVKPITHGRYHSVFKAMNLMGYDAATVGNHEFNYGIDFLQTTLKGAKFPYVSGNIFWKSGKSFLPQYKIIETTVAGEKIKIGFTGFAPPQIVDWDARWVKGKLKVGDILENAKKIVPKMKAEGADVVAVLMHGGITLEKYEKLMPGAVAHLAKINGVDVVFSGHSHGEFPGRRFSKINNKSLNNTDGTIHGKPVVMPGFWGSHLGIVQLTLEKSKGGWKVIKGKGELQSAKGIKESKMVKMAVAEDHKATLKYIRTPVGKIKYPITSYFSQISDTAITQLVNNAQIAFIKKKLAKTKYSKLPVLSAAAAFKTGFGGSKDYADIPAGKIALKHTADIYIYPNTIAAVKITGKQVKGWLERSAENFVRVKPDAKGEINILSKKFKGYNFDIIDGVTYKIDITKAKGNRIVELKYKGKPINQKSDFIVATNNYRAYGGGHFPEIDGSNVIYDDTVENREILINYIRANKLLSVKADNNWTLAPIKGLKATVYYKTAASAAKFKPKNLEFYKKDSKEGMALFKVNL